MYFSPHTDTTPAVRSGNSPSFSRATAVRLSVTSVFESSQRLDGSAYCMIYSTVGTPWRQTHRTKLRIYKQSKDNTSYRQFLWKGRQQEISMSGLLFQENIKYGGRINMIHSKNKVPCLRQKYELYGDTPQSLSLEGVPLLTPSVSVS
jgi:hypothetical protein